MNIVKININDLHEYENNPRQIDGAVNYVAKSIEEFGFKVPIIIDKNNIIVAGHTRLKAAKQLGIQEIPCIIADDLTEEQIRAFRLADNKVSELSEWDFNALNAELEKIKNIDMTMFSFEIEDILDEFDTNFDLPDDEVPQTRTITLSLVEEQFQIATKCMEYITDNNLIIHEFDNPNKKSNSLFEVVYQWAEQKNLL